MSASELEQLARWRTLGARHSEEVVKLGSAVLKSGRLGDQGEFAESPSPANNDITDWLFPRRMGNTRTARYRRP